MSAPPASAVPGLQVLAILENVESTGAPPAWSPSGEMLAFSAMPADGSHGPDVYVWSPSDAQARPITSDHDSYFASWSGERIVLSRVNAKPDAGIPVLATVVIDPRTLEERIVAGPAMWLPMVNPSGSHAVAWRGELDLTSGLAVPRTGTLYMIGWAALDPFGAGAEAAPTPLPSDQPAPTIAPPSDAAGVPPTEAPASAPAPTVAPSGAPGSPSSTPTDASAAPDGTEAPDATEPPPAPLPAGMVELGFGRDPVSAPVVDWQVRWSLDGQVLGVWIADAAGSTWGRLTVVAIDPDTQQIGGAEPLLSPTLARRGFSLGLSRVAWVAPSEDNPDGELRIRTWGDDGVGGLRLQPTEAEEVVPAF